MKKLLALVSIFNLMLLSAFAEPVNNVDCIILEDENSIICKYTVVERPENDKEVTLQWIDPNNQISRERDMLIPSGHASIYDFRYKDGREQGKWTFKVIDNSKEYTTTFTIE